MKKENKISLKKNKQSRVSGFQKVLLFLVLLLWDPNPYIGSVDIVPQFTDVHFFKLKNSFLAGLGLPCGTQAQ